MIRGAVEIAGASDRHIEEKQDIMIENVQEYIQGQAVEPFVVLRHDVDRRPEMALEMAGME